MGFSRQEHWSGLPFPPPRDLPDPGIELAFSTLTDRFFTTEPSVTWMASPNPLRAWIELNSDKGTSQVLLVIKNLTASAGDIRDAGSIPGLGKPPRVRMETHCSILA